ncbi:uracil-DNA glycosylase [Algihabitans albus]|uniref:uracil-DNA glycosylase n=1 Tax=Algihabitans albus TaxID=2164067 RepID=UPI000E5C6160|nr:uracil-DNA glycosylase [Algihabitans albus]
MLTPEPDCARCPRLADFRDANRAAYPDFFNRPVPSFGPLDARLLIVGLAPGLRGANRTGRPFTGDFAGDLLYSSLQRHGFAAGSYARQKDDGLELIGCRIVNAVRCLPPENKPTPAEIGQCRPFLEAELRGLPKLEGVLALGQVAHTATLAALGLRKSARPFRHGALHHLQDDLPWLTDSYHCSRYNQNTRRLTPEMFDAVIADLAERMSLST